MSDFRGNPFWDYRCDSSNRMFFADYSLDIGLKATRLRALSALRSYCEGTGSSEVELDGPLWALGEISHGSEAVKMACLWFRVAATCGEEDDIRLMLCREAYGKLERAMRCYLPAVAG